MKHTLRLLSILLLLAAFCLLTACGGEGDGTETDAPTGDAATEAGVTGTSETPTEAEAPTDAPAADAPTEAPTEPATEAETYAGSVMTQPDLVTFFKASFTDGLFETSGFSAEVVDDGEGQTCLRLSVDGDGKPSLTFDYTACVNALGLTPLSWKGDAYAVVTLRADNGKTPAVTAGIGATYRNRDQSFTSSASVVTADGGWTTLMFPLVTDFRKETAVTRLLLTADAGLESGDSLYVRSVFITTDMQQALDAAPDYMPLKPLTAEIEIPGLTKTYTLLHFSDLHACAWTDEEFAAMDKSRADYITQRQASFKAGILDSAAMMPFFFRFADRIGADLTLMTGDILDFPSQGNIALLKDCIGLAKTPSTFILGNHDWAFADDYQTAHAVEVNIPEFLSISDGDAYFHYTDYGDFVLVAVDNSTDRVSAETVEKYRKVKELGKPIILVLHVPLYADSLKQPCVNVWGRDITIGIGGMNAHDRNVYDFYYDVAVDENSPVAAVIAGHLHFSHEDKLPNGVTQYLTGAANDGTCRVITLKPKA